MSLINDALKKAQKQRTNESPPLSSMPSIGGEPAVRIAKRDKPLGFNSILLWAASSLTLVVLLVGGFLLYRGLSHQLETPPPTKTAPVVAKAPPAAPAAEPNVAAPIAVNPNAAYVLPNAAVPPPAETVVPKIVEPKPVAAAPVAPPPEPDVPKLVVPAPKLPAQKIAYIEAQRVAGIRASTTDSKVLMNDRVYRLGDTVEHNLGLKLVGITATSLTFEDDSGGRYTRNF